MNKIKRKCGYLFLILSIMWITSVMSGCGTQKEKTGEFHIVTSFYPIYIMAWNLTDGIDGVELANMAKPSTGCLHDYQLRPKDLVCLDGADVFLTNGGGMENFLADALEAYPALRVYAAIDALEPEELIEEEGHSHSHGEEEHGIFHGEESDHEHNDEKYVDEEYHGDEENHDEDKELSHDNEEEEMEINPHTWMDPSLYRKELAYFCQILMENDPEHKEQYQQNYEIYDRKLRELEQEFDFTDQGINALILHESFPYLLQTCKIHLAGAADVEKDSGFAAKEIRELVDVARASHAGYILSDSQYSGRISELLSEETGMKVWKLDSAVSGEYEKDAYLNSMRHNYTLISQGIGGETTDED